VYFHRFFSPAKINLYLQVLGKRNDGYHEIKSLISALSFGDYLSFRFAKQDLLSCNGVKIPLNETNLINQALCLFRRKTGFNRAVQVHVEKNIPLGSGLGGGSSNAATTLWALNTLANHPVSTRELISWAKELGSDVPFFFSKGLAFVSGRGEKINDDTRKIDFDIFLSLSELQVETKRVFANINEKIFSFSKKDICHELTSFKNHLEQSAFLLYPALKIKKQKLADYFQYVFLTGSGSSFYCVNMQKNPPKEFNCISCQAICRPLNKWYLS
jgi:4-diphosphocytidyl-2-C-methyl-D-erythritol kinase